MPLNYLLYTSKSNIKNYSILDDIIAVAEKFNLSADITGILLYDGHHFLQILEGEAEAISELYNKIKLDDRHHDCSLKIVKSFDSRNFSDWSMRLSLTSKNAIESIHTTNSVSDSHNEQELIVMLSKLVSNTFTQYKLDKTGNNDFNFFNKLTKRELSILSALVKGSSTREIGESCNISPKTVSSHIDNIRNKLGCSTSKELIKKVFESGYIMYII